MTQESDDPQRDPVIFGTDPFTHDRPPIEDDRPTYRQQPRWPWAVAIVILVAVMVAAVGIWIF
jgi:hypothetical protein